MHNPGLIRIFTDFDGTITVRDVGDAMFETFGGAAAGQAVADYRNGTISATECYRQESAACGAFRRADLDAMLDGERIDSTFSAFESFCRNQGFPLTILSDGMDYYIRRILDREGLGTITFLANRMILDPVAASPDVRMAVSFPHTDEVCDRCASCKRNHMLTMSGDDDIIVYIGEGYSDRCPVRFADVVFAKDELLRYCEEENITYFPYVTFADIQRRFETMLRIDGNRHSGIFHKRRRAELERRALYLGG